MKRFLLFTGLLFFALISQASLFKPAKFLPVEQAFVLSLQRTEQQILIHWQIAPNYYLYADQLAFTLNGKNEELTLIRSSENPQSYLDPYFGVTQIFKQNFTTYLQTKSLLQAQDQIQIRYQGCTEGFCYPPVEKNFVIEEFPLLNSSQNSFPINTPFSTQEQLAQQLFNSKYAILGFFFLGLGLAFTPCILPTLPLLSAVVIGQQQRPNTKRALLLSVVYVQGLAITYSLLGLAVVSIGLPLQIALQSPVVLIIFSLLFLLLALSMFGLFELGLPNSWQNKLIMLSQRQKSGTIAGVFVMGMIAGLIASPCTTAPLSGALLYVAQSGNFIIGALTLYLLALGMGVPLILLTLFGNKILPKAGAWTQTIKQAFGFVMLVLPVLLLARIIDEIWTERLWALLGSGFFIWLSLQLPQKSWGIVGKILLLIMAIISTQPLQNWLWSKNSDKIMVTQNLALSHQFQAIHSYAELQQALAKNPKSRAMLDFYADWCVACKQFEQQTFLDPQVQQQFENILLLQIDMSQNTPENQQLVEKLNVYGLPTLIFFDQQGKEITGSRVTGFMSSDVFKNWLIKL